MLSAQHSLCLNTFCSTLTLSQCFLLNTHSVSILSAQHSLCLNTFCSTLTLSQCFLLNTHSVSMLSAQHSLCLNTFCSTLTLSQCFLLNTHSVSILSAQHSLCLNAFCSTLTLSQCFLLNAHSVSVLSAQCSLCLNAPSVSMLALSQCFLLNAVSQCFLLKVHSVSMLSAQHWLCLIEDSCVVSATGRPAVPTCATQRRRQKESGAWQHHPLAALQIRGGSGHFSPFPHRRSSCTPAGRDFPPPGSVQRGRGGQQLCLPAELPAVGPVLHGADSQLPRLLASSSAVSGCECPCRLKGMLPGSCRL